MKTFLIKFFLFSSIFFVLNLLPNLFLSPYYGNQVYSEKYSYYKCNQGTFNTLILGSSRLYRQFNPKIFDSVLKEYQTSSFNIAAPATYNPEVYYLYEKLLEKTEPNRIKYAIIELQTLRNINSENLNTTRNYYWHNLKYLNFSIKYILTSNHQFGQKKKELIKKYLLSYFYKTLNIFYEYKTLADRKSNINKMLIGENRDGFYPLSEHMNDLGGNNDYKKRLTTFIGDTTVLEEMCLNVKKAFSLTSNEKYFNEVHFKKLNHLIKKSNKKGVHLVFIIPPRSVSYNELLAIKEKISRNHIIEIANPEKYPNLYKVEYSFDGGHLNKKGADLFSEYIARELLNNVFKMDCMRSGGTTICCNHLK
jgi:hypothetical protein